MNRMVEEIIVPTATYRDTQLMDTPLTITALTDIEIEARGVEDITDLFLSVPGLNYGQAAPTWHYVNARGIAPVQVSDRTGVDVHRQHAGTGPGRTITAASEFRPGAN